MPSNFIKNSRIIKISNIAPKAIQIDLDNGEWARLHQFGKTVFSEVSDGMKKSTLVELKKDVQLFEWNSQKLKELYINEK